MNKRNASVIFVFALTPSFIAMFLAWKHNPQCEVHCNGVINWWYLVQVGASWFFLIFIVILAIQWARKCLIIYIKKWFKGSDKIRKDNAEEPQ